MYSNYENAGQSLASTSMPLKCDTSAETASKYFNSVKPAKFVVTIQNPKAHNPDKTCSAVVKCIQKTANADFSPKNEGKIVLNDRQLLSHSKYVELDQNPNRKTKVFKLFPPIDQPIQIHAGCDSPHNKNLKRLSAGCDCPCQETEQKAENLTVERSEEDKIKQNQSSTGKCCGCKKSSKKKKEINAKKGSPKREPVKEVCEEIPEAVEQKAQSKQKSKKHVKKNDSVVSEDSSVNQANQRKCCLPIFGRRRSNKKKGDDSKKNNRSNQKDKQKTKCSHASKQDEAARIAYLEQQIGTMRLELGQIRREIMPAECTRYAVLSERLQQLNDMLTEIKNDEEQSSSECSCDTDDTIFSRTEEEKGIQYYSQHNMEAGTRDCDRTKPNEARPESRQKLECDCSGAFERWEKKQVDENQENGPPILVIDCRKHIEQWEANEQRKFEERNQEPERKCEAGRRPEVQKKSDVEQRLEGRRKSDAVQRSDSERRRRLSEQRDEDERRMVEERKADLDKKQEAARRQWHAQKNGIVKKQESERVESDFKKERDRREAMHHCCTEVNHVEQKEPCKCPHCEKMEAEAKRKRPVQPCETQKPSVEHSEPCKCPHCEKKKEARGKLEEKPFTCMHDTAQSKYPMVGRRKSAGRDVSPRKQQQPNKSEEVTPKKSCFSKKKAESKMNNEPKTTKCGKPKPIKEHNDVDTIYKNEKIKEKPKGKVIYSPSYTSEPAVLYSRKEELGKSDFSDSSSSCCIYCANKEVPTITKNLCGEIQNIIKRCNPNDIVLTVLLRADFLYHINVAIMKNSEWLGCLYATEEAIDEANTQNLFQSFLTFFIVDANNTLEQKTKILSHTFEFVRSK